MFCGTRLPPTVRLLAGVGLLVLAQAGQAHGIAGNRVFPGTMSFDDPAVADEFTVHGATLKPAAAGGGTSSDQATNWSLMRMLTPTLGIGLSGGLLHRDWGPAQAGGATPTNVTVKTELLRDEHHETLVAASLSLGLPHSGAQAVGANAPLAIEPGIAFGRGFGDAPEHRAWLRPFAITGAAVLSIPTQPATTNLAHDRASGGFDLVTTPLEPTLRWGFALEYSPLYRTERFTPGVLPKEEPVNQLVPLVEFNFDSPRGGHTAAWASPGLSYVGRAYQVSVAAIVPLNREAGEGIGARVQLMIFLDDFAPALFGKPLLGH